MAKSDYDTEGRTGLAVIFVIWLLGPVFIFVISCVALPAVGNDWLRALLFWVIIFFAAGFVMMAGIFLPNRPIERYRKHDGSYFIPRLKFPAIASSIVGLCFIPALPVIAYTFLLTLAWMIFSDPRAAMRDASPFPNGFAFSDLSLWLGNAYHVLKFVIVVVPLLIFTPWFYPAMMRRWWGGVKSIFYKTGLGLDVHGLTVFNVQNTFVPWSAVYEATIHRTRGFPQVLLRGTGELDKYRIVYSKHLPKELRMNEGLKGLLLPLDFMRVGVGETVNVINREFLRK